MTWTIPATTAYTFRQGDRGVGVWALQRALNTMPNWADVPLDGDFGPMTKDSVTRFQKVIWPKDAAQQDGIAGPGTQRALVTRHVVASDTDLPVGLLDGFAANEGGYLLAAVNRSVAGGVDCGVFQRRVYEGDYTDDAVVQRAFDVGYQADLLANRLVELRPVLQARAGTNDGYNGMAPREKAWRLAALNHNYPVGADTLSRTPIRSLSSAWTSPASWVTGFGFKFPDGTAVRTPLDWCHLYAGVLGVGERSTGGLVTMLVNVW